MVSKLAIAPVRLRLCGRDSGTIAERPRRRSQSFSWNSPREYGGEPPNPIIQGGGGGGASPKKKRFFCLTKMTSKFGRVSMLGALFWKRCNEAFFSGKGGRIQWMRGLARISTGKG